ncbi:putative acyl-activating enzyme 1 [Abeliophyllum distichum]|uniref:Acyl-activating enzyme 1 n=1 Tax=Abeliophyllum distichum TaxID=126358 RepID=A0ABD1SCZ6_9LAMI
MAGAIHCALNTGLNATTLASKLDQLEAKVVFVDYQYIEVVEEAMGMLSQIKSKPFLLVVIKESNMDSILSVNIKEQDVANCLEYERLIAMGKSDFKILYPKDERDPISINYTSGSTGMPKGVVYSHRAVYLNSLAMIFRSEMRQMPVFLWTVDMFRCNGWCFPWVMAALGGTNICLRNVSAKAILDAVFHHNVTHFCGAPVILNKIAETPTTDQRHLRHKVNITIAGTLPPREIQERLEALGFVITHGYGMSEALGPVMVKPWNQDNSTDLDQEENIKARQGIHNLLLECVDVKDPITMKGVPPDGKTVGEVMFRSNTMMLGYMKNSQATQEAFKGGWYRTRDVGVRYPNGCIEMKDRWDDIITCGGEIVSTLEIEATLAKHPMVLEAAVVGRFHHLLGETPCAFIKLKQESNYVTAEEIIKFCQCNLPQSMVPHNVIFGDLPVNSTGKIQKFVLKGKVKDIGSLL